MGKYIASINLGGHKRGVAKEYADDDVDLLRRLKAGTVHPAPGTLPPSVKKAPAADPVVINPQEETKRQPVKKRPAAKKAEEPKAEEAPQAEARDDDAPVEDAPAEGSSVQTSWFVSPTQAG